ALGPCAAGFREAFGALVAGDLGDGGLGVCCGGHEVDARSAGRGRGDSASSSVIPRHTVSSTLLGAAYERALLRADVTVHGPRRSLTSASRPSAEASRLLLRAATMLGTIANPAPVTQRTPPIPASGGGISPR